MGPHPRRSLPEGLCGAWGHAERAYGDMLSKTSEDRIRFNLPGSPNTIEATAIHAEVKVGPNTKQLPDPKTVFERPADLNTFERHAKPFIAAKVDALHHAATKPSRGQIIEIEVPVALANGADAIARVELPWYEDAAGHIDIKTWWLAQSNFAKGSAFNP
jgi:hypothetical protein